MKALMNFSLLICLSAICTNAQTRDSFDQEMYDSQVAKVSKCEIDLKEVDEFDSKTKIITATKALYGGMNFEGGYHDAIYKVSRVDSEIYLYLRHNEFKSCVNDSSYAYFLFTDGSKLKMNHVGDIDCTDAWLYINITEQLEKFKTTKIDKIRILYEDNSDDLDLPSEFESFLINSVECVLKD